MMYQKMRSGNESSVNQPTSQPAATNSCAGGVTIIIMQLEAIEEVLRKLVQLLSQRNKARVLLHSESSGLPAVAAD